MATKSSPSPTRSNDFPGGLAGGESQTTTDHRVGETTRQDPRVTDVEPAPQRPAAPSGEPERRDEGKPERREDGGS